MRHCAVALGLSSIKLKQAEKVQNMFLEVYLYGFCKHGFDTISAAVEDQPPLPPTDVLLVSFSLFGSFSLLKQLQNQIAQHSKSQGNDCGDDLCGDVHPCTICDIPKNEP